MKRRKLNHAIQNMHLAQKLQPYTKLDITILLTYAFEPQCSMHLFKGFDITELKQILGTLLFLRTRILNTVMLEVNILNFLITYQNVPCIDFLISITYKKKIIFQFSMIYSIIGITPSCYTINPKSVGLWAPASIPNFEKKKEIMRMMQFKHNSTHTILFMQRATC